MLDCRAWLESRGETDALALARELLRETAVATVPGTDFGLSGNLNVTLLQMGTIVFR